MKILALDLGKFNTMCCFFDSKTRKHEFLNATTDRNYLETIFKKHKIELVVMEACGPSGWINDLASSHGLKTLVCSTNGRQVSAYFGLVPRQYPSGETER
jgi:transposase